MDPNAKLPNPPADRPLTPVAHSICDQANNGCSEAPGPYTIAIESLTKQQNDASRFHDECIRDNKYDTAERIRKDIEGFTRAITLLHAANSNVLFYCKDALKSPISA